VTQFFYLLLGTAVGCIVGVFLLVFVFTAAHVSTFRHDCASLNGISVRTNPGWICVSKSVIIEVPK